MKRMLFYVLVASFILLFTPSITSHLNAQAQMPDEDCLNCHSDKELEAVTERGKKLALYVPENALVGSVHEGMTCTQCHVEAKSFEDVPHAPRPLEKACPDCHEEAKGAMKNDVHGIAIDKGNPRSPSCFVCHGGHQIKPLTSLESRYSKKNQADTCGRCHGTDRLLKEEKGITKRNLVSRYKSSVHWQAIVEGKNAASCTDCHGHHGILSSASERSGVSRTGVANSCQICHPIETRSFWTGAHGAALLHGNNDVPNCTTCHGDHDMATLRTRSGDAKQWASTQVCIWCHGNSRMMVRYGLDTTPVDSYMEDFHGLTQRGTMGASATCADCHDPHHSLPSNHPSSRMHISNRGPVCSGCHGKVSDSFAMSFTHQKALEVTGGGLENIVRVIYIIIIVIAVAGMLLYCFLIWLWAVRKKAKAQRKQRFLRRMSRYERVSHFWLFISFCVLVITGFALKDPQAFWAKWLFAIGINESIRAFIHRFAAIVMTLDLIFFSFYMFFNRRGKCMMKEMLPSIKNDIKDFFRTFKFYLGFSKEEHPRYRTFNFAEKFEFWALIWGTVVMVVTGLILWFPKAIPASWPSWIMPVARVIHYFEALLATLAILIWHGFHTIFHPDEYPMDTSWLTGYITDHEAKERFEDEAIKNMTKEPAPADEDD
jgi:formate dehydrogenase gamma subunit